MGKSKLWIDEFEVDGIRVFMEQLRPKKALRVAAVLARVLLPVFGSMKPTDEITQEVLNTALLGMASGLDPDAIDKITDEILCSTFVMVDNVKHDLSMPGKIDEAFEGQFGALLQVLQHAIKRNFGNFFGGVGPNGQPTPTTAP